METARPKPRFFVYFLPCILLSLVFLIYPNYVIRPFRHQGPRELLIALTVLRYRPAVMLACLAIALAALVVYWRRQRRWLRRAASAAGLLAISAVALLSRINIYEALMFHPLGAPSFTAAGESKLDGGEMVMAVKLGAEARAYPIRSMSYHHVANDLLDGVPIVATY